MLPFHIATPLDSKHLSCSCKAVCGWSWQVVQGWQSGDPAPGNLDFWNILKHKPLPSTKTITNPTFGKGKTSTQKWRLQTCKLLVSRRVINWDECSTSLPPLVILVQEAQDWGSRAFPHGCVPGHKWTPIIVPNQSHPRAHGRSFRISCWWFQPPLKNISEIGNLPQVGVKIKNLWNHQPECVL